GVAVAVGRIAAPPLWGRGVGRVGARPLLVLCSFGVTRGPVVWVLPPPPHLWAIALQALFSWVLLGGHRLSLVGLSVALAPRCGRPFYLAAFATAGGLGFAVVSVCAGLLASLLPARFALLGFSWTAIHILLMISALARAGAAVLAVRIQEANTCGV